MTARDNAWWSSSSYPPERINKERDITSVDIYYAAMQHYHISYVFMQSNNFIQEKRPFNPIRAKPERSTLNFLNPFIPSNI